jgi:hypothetical protein
VNPSRRLRDLNPSADYAPGPRRGVVPGSCPWPRWPASQLSPSRRTACRSLG